MSILTCQLVDSTPLSVNTHPSHTHTRFLFSLRLGRVLVLCEGSDHVAHVQDEQRDTSTQEASPQVSAVSRALCLAEVEMQLTADVKRAPVMLRSS